MATAVIKPPVSLNIQLSFMPTSYSMNIQLNALNTACQNLTASYTTFLALEDGVK